MACLPVGAVMPKAISTFEERLKQSFRRALKDSSTLRTKSPRAAGSRPRRRTHCWIGVSRTWSMCGAQVRISLTGEVGSSTHLPRMTTSSNPGQLVRLEGLVTTATVTLPMMVNCTQYCPELGELTRYHRRDVRSHRGPPNSRAIRAKDHHGRPQARAWPQHEQDKPDPRRAAGT